MRKILFSMVTSALFAGFLAANEFVLDEAHTSVNFKIKHMQISNVMGNFTEFEAQKIDFDVENKELKALEATIKTASINTNNQKRDEHLRTDDFLGAQKNPEIKFVSKTVRGDSITGDLTLKGVTKEMIFEYKFGGMTKKDDKMKIGFTLEGKISRKDFGVGESGAFLDDNIKIIIEVEAQEK